MITNAIFDCKYRFVGLSAELSEFKGEFVAIAANMQPIAGGVTNLRLTLRSLETGNHTYAYISELQAVTTPSTSKADEKHDYHDDDDYEEYDRRDNSKSWKSFFGLF